MFAAIFLALFVAALIVVAERMFEGNLIEEVTDENGKTKKTVDLFGMDDQTVIYKALGIGIGVGVIAYLTPKLGSSTLFLAPIFALVMIGLMIYLAYWWAQDGSNFKEMICFIILEWIFALVAMNAVTMAVKMVALKAFIPLIRTLPWAALVGCVGFFIFDAVRFDAEEKEENAKDDADKKRAKNQSALAKVLKVVLIAIVVLILLASFFKCNLGSVKTTATTAVAATDTEGDTPWSRFVAWWKGLFGADGQTATTTTRQTWYGFYNLAMLKNDDTSDDFNFGWNPYDESWTARDYDREFRSRIKKDPALGAADMAWLDAIVGTRYIGVFYDECSGKWDVAINAAKQGFMETDPTTLYYPTLDGFFAFLDTAVSVEVRKGSGIEDQMYMNPYSQYTVYGVRIPDVIVMKTDNHEGMFLVYTFSIKGRLVEVAYRIECGFQPCNVEKVMHVTPVTPVQPTPTPTPVTPTPTPTPVVPTPTPAPTPTPQPTKDPTVGTTPDPGDDPGPGDPTSTGVGGGQSSAEEPGSSDTMTYDEYREHIEQLEGDTDGQREGGDPNTPTVTPAPGTTTDDRSQTGSGSGGVDTPTPTQEPVHIEIPETGETTPISTDPGGEWGGPPD